MVATFVWTQSAQGITTDTKKYFFEVLAINSATFIQENQAHGQPSAAKNLEKNHRWFLKKAWSFVEIEKPVPLFFEEVQRECGLLIFLASGRAGLVRFVSKCGRTLKRVFADSDY